LRAKNGAMEFASKHLRRSSGVVSTMEGGPKRPDEVTHTSSLIARGQLWKGKLDYVTYRPHEFSTSSIRLKVSSSLVILYGCPMTFVFGYSLLTSAANSAYESSGVEEQA
jgi:hypothetical protein